MEDEASEEEVNLAVSCDEHVDHLVPEGLILEGRLSHAHRLCKHRSIIEHSDADDTVSVALDCREDV